VASAGPSAPSSRQTTTPAPHHSVFTGRMPFLPPNQQHQSTKDHVAYSKKSSPSHRPPQQSGCGNQQSMVENICRMNKDLASSKKVDYEPDTSAAGRRKLCLVASLAVVTSVPRAPAAHSAAATHACIGKRLQCTVRTNLIHADKQYAMTSFKSVLKFMENSQSLRNSSKFFSPISVLWYK